MIVAEENFEEKNMQCDISFFIEKYAKSVADSNG